MSENEIKVVYLTRTHIKEVCKIHLEAFQNYSHTKLGKNYVKAFFSWFINHPNSICLAAIENNKVLGYVIGAQIGYQKKMNRDLLPTIFLSVLKRPWVIFNVRNLIIGLKKIKYIVHPEKLKPKSGESIDTNGISLVGIGVAKSARNKKVGTHLIERFEKESIKMNMNFLRLTVYNTNEAARKMYEKYGWVLINQSAEEYILYYRKDLKNSV